MGSGARGVRAAGAALGASGGMLFGGLIAGVIGAVAIRQLSPAEQVLTHGTPDPIREPGRRDRPGGAYDDVRAPDGFRLLSRLRERGLLD